MKKFLLTGLAALFLSSIAVSCKERHCSAYDSAKVEKVKKDRTEKEI